MNHGPDDRSTEGLEPEHDRESADFFGSLLDGGEPDARPGAEGEWLARTLGGLGSDEAAVRRLLHSAVDGVEPG
ncbi:hypothetical protein GTY20_21420, partial [Streptomyces sp. SID4946]